MTAPDDRKVLEAILFLADEPLPTTLLAEVLERSRSHVEVLLTALASEYEETSRGFVLREVAGGWRIYTAPDCEPWLERFVRRQDHSRLSAAALEVLAIVAYRQPVSRSQIAEVRGVDSDRVVRTLAERGLVVEAGRKSGATLFAVSDRFLERLGLRSVADLPPLSSFMPSPEEVEQMETRLSPDC